MNEDAYEEYCLQKLAYEERLVEIENEIEYKTSEIDDLKSDYESIEEDLRELSVEDFIEEEI